MTSVTRFLRQIPTGLSTYAGTDLDQLYVLVPGSGNYVGNYPNSPYSTAPGYMVKASAAVVGAGTVGSGAAVIRDMGKTVFAVISTDSGATVGNPGYFRAVQVINPVSVATPTSPSNFGVNGSVPNTLPSAGNSGDMGYNTFYVPIVVNGILPANAAGVIATPFSNAPRLAGQL